MSNDTTYQQQQSTQQQSSQQHAQHQQQQQQLYMSPQTENLNQMYLLVDKLAKQLRHNKVRKQRLLTNIDTLSTQLNKEAGAKSKAAKPDEPQSAITLFKRFLEARDTFVDVKKDDHDDIALLRAQNESLKKVLKDKIYYNKMTLGLLEDHEDGLTTVVAMLREDVFQYYTQFTQRVRQRMEQEAIPSEDAEFSLYLHNIRDVQKLMDISALYRLLLRMYE